MLSLIHNNLSYKVTPNLSSRWKSDTLLCSSHIKFISSLFKNIYILLKNYTKVLYLISFLFVDLIQTVPNFLNVVPPVFFSQSLSYTVNNDAKEM